MADAPRPSRGQDSSRLDEQLVALATGELDGVEAARVEAEIAADPARQAELGRLKQVLSVIRVGAWPEPGSDARSAVLEAFSARTARTARATLASGGAAPATAVERLVRATMEWIEAAECVVADLVFDRRQQVAMPGFRGAGGGVSYATDSGRLDLDIQSPEPEPGPGRDLTRVRGQFRDVGDAGSGHASNRRVLVTDERGLPIADAATDERGVFQIELPVGRFDLYVVKADGRRFAVRDLVVD